MVLKPSGRLDWPGIVAALVLGLVTSLAFAMLLGVPGMVNPVYVVLLGVLWVIRWALYLAMLLIIASAVLSLINPQAPLAWPLAALTAPLLKSFRRVLPMVGQFDLTPLVALLVIQVVLVLVDPTVVLALLGGH